MLTAMSKEPSGYQRSPNWSISSRGTRVCLPTRTPWGSRWRPRPPETNGTSWRVGLGPRVVPGRAARVHYKARAEAGSPPTEPRVVVGHRVEAC